MTSSRIERALLLAGVGFVAACSLVIDTDDLSGGAPDAGRDGSTMDAASSDASAEASTDGGSDARWCATHAPDGGFCDDFDDPGRTNPALFWDELAQNPGRITIVPPGVLQLDWPADVPPADGDCNYLRLLKEMPRPVTKWSFGFDVFLGDGKGGGFFDDAITNIVWHPSGAGYCQLFFNSPVNNPGLDDDNTHRALKEPMTLGVWHRVEITVDGNSGAVGMTIDGANAFASPQTIPTKCRGTSDVGINHGLFCARKNPGAERVLFDNVTFAGE